MRLLFLPLRQEYRLVIACQFGLLLSTGLSVTSPALLSVAVDVVLARSGDGVQSLLRAVLSYVAVVIAGLGVGYAFRLGTERIAQNAIRWHRSKSFTRLLAQDASYHDRHPSGELIARIEGDIAALRPFYTEVLFALPADILLVLGMFAVMEVQAPRMAVVLGGAATVYLAVLALSQWLSPRYYIRVLSVRAELSHVLSEALRSIPAVALFGGQHWLTDRVAAVESRYCRANQLAQIVPQVLVGVLALLRALGTTMMLWVGVGLVRERALSPGQMIMGLTYVQLMATPVARISLNLSILEQVRAAWSRVRALLTEMVNVSECADALPWPKLTRAIRIESMSFGYHPDRLVLEDVNLSIPAGASIGIVGPTGSGKSTLVSLIARLRDPSEGMVKVDDIDVRTLRIAELRREIAVVPQDPTLIPGTLLDNLGGDSKAALATLSELGFELPLDTPLGDAQVKLSRGERQTISLARAMIGHPEVLVLDEALASMDPETERRALRALCRWRAGTTLVIVAHRLSTVMQCDRIFVIADGRVIEQGSPKELLAHAGLFAHLSRLQVGRFDT